MRLGGKVAIITGAAGGIGAETARLFCAEGAAAALVDLDPAALEATRAKIVASVADARLAVIAADIAEPEAASRAVAETRAAFGGLDVLVNNAGVRAFATLAEASIESWQRIIRVNLLGTITMTRSALPALRGSGAGAIVNVSSVYAEVGRAGMGQYDATKAAIVSMTRTLAWEEAAHGIRVNAVCPGGTLTPYHLARFAEAGRDAAEVRAEVKQSCLMRRWGESREIAYPILWLASDEASFITGTSLMVDGGTSAM